MAKGINPNLKVTRRSSRGLDEYLAGLANGDRYVLSEALTLIESTETKQRSLGEEILNRLGGKPLDNTIRIGVTGSPGAGKSTFIEAFGNLLVKEGKKVAVLAIDPSSTRSQGSILGDKTRMHSLSTHQNAFIRPSASANFLGGVARATKEAITLCEAAGYDVIIVESVGVGQSETELANLVDIYLLLLLPGGGDGVQGIKRGVVELTDLMIVNKYDGESKTIAEKSRKDFALASTLFHHELSEWTVPVELCSSTENIGLDTIWSSIASFISLSKKKNHFYKKRHLQDQKWFANQIKILIGKKAELLFMEALNSASEVSSFTNNESVFKKLQEVSQKIELEYNIYLQKKI